MAVIKHNMSSPMHPAYSTWGAMKQRCSNPNRPNYKLYGGRGITFCKKWENFVGFWEDMGEDWSFGTSIERINVNGNYKKSNCRWATPKEQSNNRRNTTAYKGKCYAQISRELGGCRNTVMNRIKKGWSIEKAVTTKVNKWGKYNNKELNSQIK